MGDKRKMTGEELNILSKIRVRPVEEQRDYLLEQNMLLAGKIATLEKENAELKKELKDANEKVVHLACNQNKDLKKENAELKGLKDVATLIRANNDTVTTLMQLNNMLVTKNQQLTKAKEYIKLLLMNCVGVYESTGKNIAEIQAEAEQFLNEVEK